MKKTLLILSAVIALSACTSNGSVSNYAIGDDSAAIKAGRNRAEAQLSRAELEQHRRQRTNVSEELALEREKRANKHDAVREGMGTAAGGLGLLNGVLVQSAISKPCSDLPIPSISQSDEQKSCLELASNSKQLLKYKKSGMSYNHYDADVNTKQTGYHAKAETKAKG